MPLVVFFRFINQMPCKCRGRAEQIWLLKNVLYQGKFVFWLFSEVKPFIPGCMVEVVKKAQSSVKKTRLNLLLSQKCNSRILNVKLTPIAERFSHVALWIYFQFL